MISKHSNLSVERTCRRRPLNRLNLSVVPLPRRLLSESGPELLPESTLQDPTVQALLFKADYTKVGRYWSTD